MFFMKFIDVTNSHSSLVRSQLDNTDAQQVRVYSLGNTTVIYTISPKHDEIALINKQRSITPEEINTVMQHLTAHPLDRDACELIETDKLVEISIPKKK